MYVRPKFKRIKSIIAETVASTGTSTNYNSSSINTTSLCNVPGSTLLPFGQNFECTVECTTGVLFILADNPIQPTSLNGFKMIEGGVLDVQVENYLNIRGESTTAKFQAIIWRD